MVTVDMAVEAIMVTMGIVDTDTMATAALVDTVVIMEIPVVTRATIDNKKMHYNFITGNNENLLQVSI